MAGKGSTESRRSDGARGEVGSKRQGASAARSGSSTRRSSGSTSTRRGSGKVLVEKFIEVDGLRVIIARKDVKTLRIHVKPPRAEVRASVPLWMPDSQVAEFVRAKRTWIDQRIDEIHRSPYASAADASADQVKEWKAVVSACVPFLIAQWEPIMGVKAGSVVYRNMTSRWGSCQPATGRICINVRLALYPPECLEYVVVHELCHLLERGHGPRFHAYMDRFMPDWRERRAKLR